MTILDNKTSGYRNCIDPLSVGVHHLQSWDVVLPENGETLFTVIEKRVVLEMVATHHLVASAKISEMDRQRVL